MGFPFSMSIFSSAADAVSREKGKAQEWIRSQVAREDGKGAAAAEKGKPPQERQNGQRAQLARGTPLLAPEFDGINCFETIVWH